MERQIDREIAADNRAMGISIGCGTEINSTETTCVNSISVGTDGDEIFESDSEEEDENNDPMMIYGPQPQIITNDLKSLDEMVSCIVIYYYYYFVFSIVLYFFIVFISSFILFISFKFRFRLFFYFLYLIFFPLSLDSSFL